jgi:endonuclease/exonuclease/phosphatase family metal-dependent hydrolase
VLFVAAIANAGESADSGLDQLQRCDYAPEGSQAGSDLRVITWNIERGIQYGGILDFLRSARADVLLLQEVDVNARRSGARRVHDELARELRMNCVFGAAFEELGQRTSSGPALQGQAILTKLPIQAARIIRFRKQSDFWRPRWYLPDLALFQRRIGGRLALVAELKLRTGPLVLYNVHLESRGKESFRVEQLDEILEDLRRYPPETPILLAGDLNVEGASSPVIQKIQSAGFRRAAGSQVTTMRGAPLDWIFIRGKLSAAGDEKVHKETRAADHYPVSVTIPLTR